MLIDDNKKRGKKEMIGLFARAVGRAISVLNAVNVEDYKPGIVTSDIPFHGNAGPNESKKFIQSRFNGSIAIKIIRRNCGVNVVVASKV